MAFPNPDREGGGNRQMDEVRFLADAVRKHTASA